MNALVVFDDPLKRELISFFLEENFGFVVQGTSSSADALPLLKFEGGKRPFELLICDYVKDTKALAAHVLAQSVQLPFLCSAALLPNDPRVSMKETWLTLLSDTNLIEGIESHVKRIFKNIQPTANSADGEFAKISPQLLLQANPLKGDIYVRLSELKFVRIMRKGLDFENDDLDYFCVKRKFETLYIKKADVAQFALAVQSKIHKKKTEPSVPIKTEASDPLLEEKRKKLEELKAKARALELKKAEVIEIKPPPQAGPIPKPAPTPVSTPAPTSAPTAPRAPAVPQKTEEDPAKLAAMAKALEKDLAADLENVQKMGQTLGFTKEVQTITKNGVLNTINSIRAAPKLSALLLSLRNEKERYISSHSMLLAYTGCALAGQMEWRSDTTYQKITLAAFLHDATLKNQDLAAIQTLGELKGKQASFTAQELKDYKDHPSGGAEIARLFSEIPPDVDVIISQHHERPDGKGFPRGLTHSRIGPLSAVFIIAHELVSFLFKSDSFGSNTGSNLIAKFMELDHSQYQHGNFKKVLAIVSKIKV